MFVINEQHFFSYDSTIECEISLDQESLIIGSGLSIDKPLRKAGIENKLYDATGSLQL